MGVARGVWPVLGMVAVLLASAAPAGARDLPAGSYLASCQEAKIRSGRDLAAVCETSDGGWVVTLLEDFASCTGDIANKDGQLWCGRGSSLFGFGGSVVTAPVRPATQPATQPATRPATQPATTYGNVAPPGSYLSSCRDIVFDSQTLRALCLNRLGTWLPATLHVGSCRGRDISNEDGSLRCDGSSSGNRGGGSSGGWGGGEPLPPGSYIATCQDITFSGGAIRARCQDRGGFFRTSVPLYVSQCQRGADIYNDNGSLRCGSGGSWGERPPPGSYTASCRDIRVVAGWLKASCKDRNGRWTEATTAVSWCSAGRDIANDDGRLTCR
ncbi:CVNH domain-containing protein [Xanthobacter sp. V4C-4]|uniref:CVNH domain-containing protein n=1 Tax=Xanthobacter cornucopiae TaxID=3119924 RepID=UPI00372B7186